MENKDKFDSANADRSSLLSPQNIQSPTSSLSPSVVPTAYASQATGLTSMLSSPTEAVPSVRQVSIPSKRRARLQRSERLQSDGSSQQSSYSSLEALIRDSFGQIVWPIRITSWDLLNNTAARLQPDFTIPRYGSRLLWQTTELYNVSPGKHFASCGGMVKPTPTGRDLSYTVISHIWLILIYSRRSGREKCISFFPEYKVHCGSVRSPFVGILHMLLLLKFIYPRI